MRSDSTSSPRSKRDVSSRWLLASRLGHGLKTLIKHGPEEGSPTRIGATRTESPSSPSATRRSSDNRLAAPTVSERLSSFGAMLSPSRDKKESPLKTPTESHKIKRGAAKRNKQPPATSFAFASPFFQQEEGSQDSDDPREVCGAVAVRGADFGVGAALVVMLLLLLLLLLLPALTPHRPHRTPEVLPTRCDQAKTSVA
jgi:hypothetical protein